MKIEKGGYYQIDNGTVCRVDYVTRFSSNCTLFTQFGCPVGTYLYLNDTFKKLIKRRVKPRSANDS